MKFCTFIYRVRRRCEVLHAHLGLKDNEGIGPWNDTPGRTAEEVIAALRGAAKLP